MPYKDPEKRKECKRRWAEENKEKTKQSIIQYRHTEKGKKSIRINNWRSRGVIHQNFDELYERFINTEYCELCNVKLSEDKKTTKTTRVLDHDHQTGEFRNIICHSCNTKRG